MDKRTFFPLLLSLALAGCGFNVTARPQGELGAAQSPDVEASVQAAVNATVAAIQPTPTQLVGESAAPTKSPSTTILLAQPFGDNTLLGKATVISGRVSGGPIARVEIRIDGALYAQLNALDVSVGVSEFPIQVPWTPLKLGETQLTVLVFEPGGALVAQSDATVAVKSPMEETQPLSGTVEAIRLYAVITLTAPTTNTQVRVGDTLMLKGMATGAFIARIEIKIDDILYAVLNAPDVTSGVSEFPFAVPWEPQTTGRHTLQVSAYGPGSPSDPPLSQTEPLTVIADAS